jgi:hypothetical protein
VWGQLKEREGREMGGETGESGIHFTLRKDFKLRGDMV